jgi:hypothetical protein
VAVALVLAVLAFWWFQWNGAPQAEVVSEVAALPSTQ